MVVNDLANASDFELEQDVVCEFRPYNSCSSFSDVEEYTAAVQGFEVFPNPTRAGSPVSLRWEGKAVEYVNIYDVHGRLIRQYHLVPGSNNLGVNLETLGVYWVYLYRGGRMWVEKVVVGR